MRQKLPKTWATGCAAAADRGTRRPTDRQRVQGLQFSFEPADIVNEVMSFGSPTPIEVAVSGPDFAQDRAYAEKSRPSWRRSRP